MRKNVETIVGWFISTALPAIKGFINAIVGAINFLSKNWKGAIGFITNLFGSLPIVLPKLMIKAIGMIIGVVRGINWAAVFKGIVNFWMGLPGKIFRAFKGLGDLLIGIDWGKIGKGIVNKVIGAIEGLVRGVIAGFPGGGVLARGFNIPRLQEGGIITRPTLALVGEQAPRVKEAVIPLKPGVGGVGGTTLNVFIGMYAGTPVERRRIAEELMEAIEEVRDARGL